MADPDDTDGDGISGRPNWVWDAASEQQVLGRFGWKANVASVGAQVTGAFIGDLGITSDAHPDENCPGPQTACAAAQNGGSPEIPAARLSPVVLYARTLSVPAMRNIEDPDVQQGSEAFVADVILEESELILDDAWLVVDREDEPLFMLIAPDAEMAVDRLVNDAIFVLEVMTDMELGRALGETSTEGRLDAVVEGPQGLGAADMRAHLDGLRAVFLGTDHATDIITEAGTVLSFDGSSGFRQLLDDELVSRLTDQFAAAKTALGRIEGPLREAVVNDSATVSAARAALKELQVTVSTEVVAQLGVTIGFSDADGDSSA